MTDKPAESLNLVERMAKRLAAEQTSSLASPEPVTGSLIERAAQRMGQDDLIQPDRADHRKAQARRSSMSLPAAYRLTGTIQ
jgi:hypothetical protein